MLKRVTKLSKTMHNIQINFSKFYSIYKELFDKGVNTKEFLIDWKHENVNDTVSSTQLNTATTPIKLWMCGQRKNYQLQQSLWQQQLQRMMY